MQFDQIRAGQFFRIDSRYPEKPTAGSLILVVEKTPEYLIGLITDLPLEEIPVSDVFPGMTLGHCCYLGGLVQPNTYNFVHSFSEAANIQHITGRWYYGGYPEGFILLNRENKLRKKNFKVFIGYCRWTREEFDRFGEAYFKEEEGRL